MNTHKLKFLTMGHIDQIKELWVPGKDTFNDKEAFSRSLNTEQLTELLYITGDWTYEDAVDEVMSGRDVAFQLCRKQRLESLYRLI